MLNFDTEVGFPPHDEQSAIAAFLDRETGRIDRLIAEHELLIECLAEYRNTVITRAVTRGLPPGAACAARPRPGTSPQTFGNPVDRRHTWALGNQAAEVYRHDQRRRDS